MPPKSRLDFIDLHKGIVLLIMIEVHVFNSMLIPEIRGAGWFSVINFINGLVAPSFIFVSGFAFSFSSPEKVQELKRFRTLFWKQLSRLFLIILAGYSLRVPFSLAEALAKSRANELSPFLIVDVLQCIGTGLLFLMFWRMLIKNDKILAGVLGGLIALILVISPFMWNAELHNYFPYFIANYFTNKYGSLFPVLPWLTFMLMGYIFGYYFTLARKSDRIKDYFRLLYYVSFALIIIGHLTVTTVSPMHIEMPRPNFFFLIMRLGYILFLFSVCKSITDKFDLKNSFILNISRASLLVYWLHLILIFGYFWNGQSLVGLVGPSLDIPKALLMTLGLIIVMVLIANNWSKVKIKRPELSQKITVGFVAILLIIFLIR
ncbi:MAG: heparan-alpha-glucosaminide N-acetyltransferase domain-containing protein [Ignavibacteriaceae bacterium]